MKKLCCLILCLVISASFLLPTGRIVIAEEDPASGGKEKLSLFIGSGGNTDSYTPVSADQIAFVATAYPKTGVEEYDFYYDEIPGPGTPWTVVQFVYQDTNYLFFEEINIEQDDFIGNSIPVYLNTDHYGPFILNRQGDGEGYVESYRLCRKDPQSPTFDIPIGNAGDFFMYVPIGGFEGIEWIYHENGVRCLMVNEIQKLNWKIGVISRITADEPLIFEYGSTLRLCLGDSPQVSMLSDVPPYGVNMLSVPLWDGYSNNVYGSAGGDLSMSVSISPVEDTENPVITVENMDEITQPFSLQPLYDVVLSEGSLLRRDNYQRNDTGDVRFGFYTLAFHLGGNTYTEDVCFDTGHSAEYISLKIFT